MIILFNDSPQYPNRSVGAYRIASVLRQHGVEVEVIDFLSKWGDSLFDYLDKIENVEWWGFSGKFRAPRQRLNLLQKMISNSSPNENQNIEGFFTQASMDFENRLITYIKNRNGKIVVGGPSTEHIKLFKDEVHIDILCEGYADIGVIAIHEHIVNKQELIYTITGNMKVVDCDKDYKDIDLGNISTNYHHSDFIEQNTVFPIEISRGCIFHCAFCSFGHLGKKPGTYIRSKESIKEDIVDKFEKYGSTKFLFVDDTFNDSIEKMQLIKEIRDETGIPFEFWSYARLDLLRAQPKMVDLIGEIGWTSFTFGVETFNKSSGSAVGKGADPEKLKQFLIDLRNRYPDRIFQINFIVGLPHDTEESVRESIQWFIDNPQITKHIRVRPLSIHRPDLSRFSSKMAKDPESYGYQTAPVPNDKHSSMVIWRNKVGMDIAQADNLSKELEALIVSKLAENNPLIPPTVMNNDILSTDEDGRIVNKKSMEIVRNYIVTKKKYRGLV